MGEHMSAVQMIQPKLRRAFGKHQPEDNP